MALKPDGSTSGMRFGARPFKPTVAIDFAGPWRFAEGLQRRFLLGEAAGGRADRVFADSGGTVISVRPQINVGIAVEAASSPEPQHQEAPPRLELLREHVHTRSERVVVHDRALARMSPAERFHHTVQERFTRVEPAAAAVRSGRPGPEQPAPLPRLPAGGAVASPAAPLVLHRPKPETVTVEAPAVRQLPASLQPGNRPRISAKEIGYLADEVISLLNRQSIAWRERFGRS